MSTPAQKRALKIYRDGLDAKGLARFEVLAPGVDRDLIRALARRLAQEGSEAERIRAAVAQTIAGEPPRTGGVLAALRRSPLVGGEVALERAFTPGRAVDL